MVCVHPACTADSVYAVDCSSHPIGRLASGGGDDVAYLWDVGSDRDPIQLAGAHAWDSHDGNGMECVGRRDWEIGPTWKEVGHRTHQPCVCKVAIAVLTRGLTVGA